MLTKIKQSENNETIVITNNTEEKDEETRRNRDICDAPVQEGTDCRRFGNVVLTKKQRWKEIKKSRTWNH